MFDNTLIFASLVKSNVGTATSPNRPCQLNWGRYLKRRHLSLLSGIAFDSDSSYSVIIVCVVSMSSRYSVPSSGFENNANEFFIVYLQVFSVHSKLSPRWFSRAE